MEGGGNHELGERGKDDKGVWGKPLAAKFGMVTLNI